MLEHLVLDDNCLGDTGVQDLVHAFTENHVLNKLGLGTNMIGVAGIISILPILPQLTQLSLGGNKFGDDGAKLLANKLKDNTSLISFSCHSCSLSHTGKQALVDSLHQNATMRNFFNDASCEQITNSLLGKGQKLNKRRKDGHL